MKRIVLTAEFDSVQEAAEFLTRPQTAALPIPFEVNAKPAKQTGTPAPSTTPAPVPVTPPVTTGTPPVAPDAAVALVIPAAAPAPQAAAPKVANKPVQAVANANAVPIALQAATLEGVKLALKDVFNNRGATKATEILKDHGAVSVSTIAKDKYASFVEACSKA